MTPRSLTETDLEEIGEIIVEYPIVGTLLHTLRQREAEIGRLREVVDAYAEMEKLTARADDVGAMDAYTDAARARNDAWEARLRGRRALAALNPAEEGKHE